MTDIYFRLIRFALGIDEGKEFLDGSALRGFDWHSFFEFAKKQTLVGVIFEGVQRLPKEVSPERDLLLRWFALSQQIAKRNRVLNKASVYIYNQVRAEGENCCILKGQGNAVLYPNPFSRTSGDVDVWVDASRERIREMAASITQKMGRVVEESYNHIVLEVNGVTMEIHSTPALLNNPVYNRRLQNWLHEKVAVQCAHFIELPQQVGSIAVPTPSFNAVYQLLHLYHHFFYEGVGLRQILDYYFVLVKSEELSVKSEERRVKNSNPMRQELSLQQELKHLGMWKFAGAVMYVLHQVLGLPESQMIVPMDLKRGRLLLDEILEGGNFGFHDERYAWGRDEVGADGFKHGALGHNLLRLYRDARLLRYYPSEALSEPFFRVWHFFWRKKNK